jgi:DNA polymerase-3 subunit delta'
MKFSDIPGHEDVKQRLREIVDANRMPHALLLEGPEGSAKFALARALAQYIHCTNRHDGDSCGVCPSCRQHASFSHIDAIYSFPVIKKNSKATISDDYLPEFNELMQENPWMDFEAWLTKLQSPNTLPSLFVEEGNALIRRLSFTAHAAKYKIVLMWQPERMREDTANKMLKLVEEPFADTIFIMSSDNPRQILPTIYSRVQRVAVKRYENDIVAQWLTTQGVSDAQAAADAAMLAEGNLNKALKLISIKSENTQYLDWFMQLMRLAYQRKIADLKQWSQTVGSEKREMLIRFLNYCCRMLRENFIYNFHNPQFNLMTEAESKFAVNFARFINERNVLKLFDAFSDAAKDISGYANGKIVMFDLAITVILLLKN